MPDWVVHFLGSKLDVIGKEWPMLLLIAILVSLAVWKLAQLYYRQEIKVLERTVSMLQVRPSEDTQHPVEVSKPVDVERKRIVQTFLATCSDEQCGLLRWMLKRDKAPISDMPILDGISEFLNSAVDSGIVLYDPMEIQRRIGGWGNESTFRTVKYYRLNAESRPWVEEFLYRP
jgi:hypothetical protein